MLAFNRLIAVAMTAVLLGPMLPLDAKTRKGDRFFADGRIHEAKKEWDAALESYKQALETDPGEMLYEMACDRARFQASQFHVENGLKIRGEGRLGEALLEFQKAVFINPGSVIAGQEMQATQQMILRERKRLEETGREAPPEIRALTPYQEARRQEDEKISRIQGIPELKPLDPQPFDFSLHGQKTKKAFEALGAIVRVNVLFDPEFTESATPITVDLQKTTVEEALSYLSTVTKSWWKVLSPNTIFIYNDNQNKRRDYEEMVTKVYYLQNVTQATELQEMQNILRTGCDINRVFPYNTGFALVVRGEADRVTLCEKLIRDIDKPKSEVMVDFLVMEASDTFNRQLAAAIASSGLNLPISFSPRSSIQVQSSTTSTSTTSSSTSSTATTSTGSTVSGTSSSTTGTQIPISQLGHLASADFATTLPGALLQAAMSDSRSKVLQAPQIRAMDNVKATMNIGERVPVASGSFSPGISGVGVSSLVNTQFNYQDVGVNVEMLARVLEGNEVYINVKIDISNIDGYQTQSGISEPIIGQRKIQEDLRVKEGEVALLGGVIKQQDDITLTGVPGLMKIPLLGKLFSGKTNGRSRDDLMIVLIPHIIRRPQYTPDNVRALAVGNQTIMLRYAPPKPVEFPVDGQIPGKVDYAPAAPGNPAPPAAAIPQGQPVMPSPAIVPPPGVPAVLGGIGTAPQVTAPAGGAPPATAPPATAPPATAPPATAPPATAPPGGDSANPAAKPADQPPAPPAVRVLFNPAQMESRINGLIPVSVVLEGGADITAAPMLIRFDPKMLKLNEAISGDLMAADGQTPLLTKNIQNDVGQASIIVSRTPGTGGVTRPAGVLVNLIFQAIGRGTTTVTMPTIAIRNAQGQPVPATGPQMIIETH